MEPTKDLREVMERSTLAMLEDMTIVYLNHKITNIVNEGYNDIGNLLLMVRIWRGCELVKALKPYDKQAFEFLCDEATKLLNERFAQLNG